jgi:hypothetical protein
MNRLKSIQILSQVQHSNQNPTIPTCSGRGNDIHGPKMPNHTPLKISSTLVDPQICEKDEYPLVGNVESGDAANGEEALDGMASSSFHDSDWNTEYISPLSSASSFDYLSISPPSLDAKPCRRRASVIADNQANDFGKSILTTIAEEPVEGQTPEEKAEEQTMAHESNNVGFSSAGQLLPILLRSFQRKKVAEIKKHLKIIQCWGWAKFWGTASSNVFPADLFANIFWMAEVVKEFGLSPPLGSANLISIQLAPRSVELALQYARDPQTPDIIPQIRGELKSILVKAGVTDLEFLLAINLFVESLDEAVDAEGLSQVTYRLGRRRDFIVLLIAFVPTRYTGREE